MRLLALDAATEACSVALFDGAWRDDGQRGEARRDVARRDDARRDVARRDDARMIHRIEQPGRGHAERLLVLVAEVLAEAGLDLAALDAIACSIGPGAFTGVRITVAAAQGLAFGANLPVVAVTTLEALALPVLAAGAHRVLACLDARMNEVYWACHGVDTLVGARAMRPPAVSTAQAVLDALGSGVGVGSTARWHGAGRGFMAQPLLRALPGLELAPGAEAALPDARDIARLGAARFAAGEATDPAQLMPLYVRDKVAWTSAERAARSGVMELSQPTAVIRAPEESRD